MSDTAEQAMPTKSNAAESSGFLDGQEYTAAFLYEFVALLVGNGVYNGELATTATSGDMSVTHGTGHAWINGVLYKNSTPFSLPINTADGSLNRYDSLMVRLDLSSNEAYAVIVQGEYAATPTAPAVTRNAETYDLKICDIYVPAGCTKITQAQITDTRLDPDVCGVPVFPVEHLDTEAFYKQVLADLAEFKAGSEADFTEWVKLTKQQIHATLKNLVDTVEADADTADKTVKAAATDATDKIRDYLAELRALIDGDTVGLLTDKIDTARGLIDKLTAAVEAGEIHANTAGTADFALSAKAGNVGALLGAADGQDLQAVLADFVRNIEAGKVVTAVMTPDGEAYNAADGTAYTATRKIKFL